MGSRGYRTAETVVAIKVTATVLATCTYRIIPLGKDRPISSSAGPRYRLGKYEKRAAFHGTDLPSSSLRHPPPATNYTCSTVVRVREVPQATT